MAGTGGESLHFLKVIAALYFPGQKRNKHKIILQEKVILIFAVVLFVTK